MSVRATPFRVRTATPGSFSDSGCGRAAGRSRAQYHIPVGVSWPLSSASMSRFTVHSKAMSLGVGPVGPPPPPKPPPN